MKFAIIQASGTQYKVQEGDVITVDKIDAEKKSDVTFGEVLMLSDGDKVVLGTPHIKNTHVVGQIIEQKQGEKIRVAKYRSKSRTRRVIGSRAKLTDVKITSINSK